jgi:spermidine synthase
MTHALLFTVFVIATCGLVYELVAATLASYLLGDSVTQFSTVIGTYLFSMGIGSWLSRYVGRGLVTRFVQVELAVGVIGGLSSSVLFLAFSYSEAFRLVLYIVVAVVGTLVGLEIPLLLRILRERLEFRELVAQVLTFDYLGALAASLAFPIVLVPRLGLVRAALLFGLINAAVALWSTRLFAAQLAAARPLRMQCLAAIGLLGAGFVMADRITALSEENLYADEIILARSSQYQRIVVTRWKNDVRLFLNGHLQFSSRDEHRYHEALVHPALSAVPHARRVLVLGGGDGLAVREILRHPGIEAIRVVDLDPVMTDLFTRHPELARLNGRSLSDPKVRIVNQDAFVWLARGGAAGGLDDDAFDLIVVDLPDPSSFSLGKLYTTGFYRLLSRHLSRQGLAVVQATSPLFARRSFWCIVETIRAAGLTPAPYHAYVPAFGEWGFVIASPGPRPYRPPERFPPGLRFLDAAIARALFAFPPDMAPVPVAINRLNNQALVGYYDEEWREIVK